MDVTTRRLDSEEGSNGTLISAGPNWQAGKQSGVGEKGPAAVWVSRGALESFAALRMTAQNNRGDSAEI